MAVTGIRHRVLKVAPVVLAAAIAALVGGSGAPSLAKVVGAVPIEKRVGLRPGQQLAAMRAAIAAAPGYFDGYSSGCDRTTPVIAQSQGQTLAGNFRDQQSGCYVWLNLAQAPLLDAQEICKLALHEMGHLGGLQHSADSADVMYAPFQSEPIPAPCSKPI